MKLIGNFIRRSIDEDGDMEITFKISNWQYRKWIEALKKKEYAIEIKEVKSQRSINQNNYLWSLIHDICCHENASSNDEWEMYCVLLERANAKFEWILCLQEAVEELKKQVRAIRVYGYEERPNGSIWAQCKVYVGSSKMNTEEMGKLIDATLEYAHQLGLDTAFYDEVLR